MLCKPPDGDMNAVASRKHLDVWDDSASHYDEEAIAGLVLAIANIDLWNRLNVATRQVAGAYEW